MSDKRLYVIAGCNGAGKTTASKQFLPSILECRQWVNADEIAYGLSPLDPMTVSFQAGRLMLERIQELLASNETFAIETTLATRSYRNLVLQAQAQGYRVKLIFFYLPSPQVALDRVAHRVRNGGHFVPDEMVVRRHNRGLDNLTKIFMPIVDSWTIFRYEDNCYRQIAESIKGQIWDFNANNMVKENDAPYVSELNRRLLECCNQAVLEMIREMALHDELVVMIDREGMSYWCRAREVLEKNPDLKLPNVQYTPVEVDIKQIIESRKY